MGVYRDEIVELITRDHADQTITLKILKEYLDDDVEKGDLTAILTELAENGIQVSQEEILDPEYDAAIKAMEHGARDNLRIYQDEVGGEELLKRDEEIAFAKLLETGLREQMAALGSVDVVLEKALELIQRYEVGNKLQTLIAGSLVPLDELPKIVLKTSNRDTTSITKAENQAKAILALIELKVHVEQFVKLACSYLSKTRSRRSDAAVRKLEASFSYFKFKTKFFDELLAEFQTRFARLEQMHEDAAALYQRAGASKTAISRLRKADARKWPKVPTGNGDDVREKTRNSVTARIEDLRLQTDRLERKLGHDYASLCQLNKRLLAGKELAKEATHGLAKGNLRLAFVIAQKYKNRGVLLEDLVQEGNNGLLRAITKYDYKTGYKFSTYATWWIRQSVTRALSEFPRTVRLPANVNQDIRNVIRAQDRLTQLHGEIPTYSEIARELNKPRVWVENVFRQLMDIRTLDGPVNRDEDSSTLADILPDENAEAPEDILDRKFKERTVWEALARLPVREQRVVSLLFGIGRGEALSVANAATEMGLSRERVRQLQNLAISRLRKGRNVNELKSFFDG